MKIKSTVWIACLVIPLALVWLLMRSQVVRGVAAQEAERLQAVVAPADKPIVDSPALQKAGTELSKPDAARNEPEIGSDLEASAPPDAVTDKELAIPNVDPLVVKPDDNAPPATERPIGPIRKAEVRVKEVPTQVPIKKAEVHFTETYRLKNQNAARIAEELKKMVPELEIILDPGNESVIIQEMTPKMREFVTEVIQRLSAARQGPLDPLPDIETGLVADPFAPRIGGTTRALPSDPIRSLRGTAQQRIPDLAGNWTGEGWGRVELRQTEPGVFRGSYLDTDGRKSGSLALRWSAEERRFNGEWTEGDKDRLGEITARMTDAGNVILGAFSADTKSKINPGKPKLADFQWTRVIPPGVVINVPAMGPLPLAISFSDKEPDADRDSSNAARQPGRVLSRDRNVVKEDVRRAFEARQESLRKEVAEFRSRIDRLTVTLHERDRQKDTIIEHRVNELLNPTLRWDATGNPAGGSGMEPSSSGSTARHYPLVGFRTLTEVEVPNPPPAARASDFRFGDSAFSVGTINKELEFLNQYPRFSGLSLDITETQFRVFLEKQKLGPQLIVQGDQLNYSVPLGDGNRLTVMFGLDGKCRGIERIGGSEPSPILPQPAPPVPVHAEKVVAKIFRLEQVDAASVAKTLQELASEKPFSARISADVTSNSVIVFANPDDMPVIEAVIIRLDKAPESPILKRAPLTIDDSSPTEGTSEASNTAKPGSARLTSDLNLWQGRWLPVSAEINGQDQKRDEISTQSITVSGSALKIAVRNSETKGFLLVDGALKLGSLPGGTKVFTFQTPSGQITWQVFETVDGVTRAKDISYELPIPLTGIYEFREGKLVLCFHDLGSKDTPKHPDKFKTTPDSDLHLYIFDKVAELDAAAPASEAGSPSK